MGNVVLIVEPSEPLAKDLAAALAKAGIADNPFRVTTGEEAQEYLFRRGRFAAAGAAPRPCLVLMTAALPRLTGPQLVARMRQDKVLRGVPVVLLTSANPAEVNSGYDAGANSCIRRPTTPAECDDAARRLREYWFETALVPHEQR